MQEHECEVCYNQDDAQGDSKSAKAHLKSEKLTDKQIQKAVENYEIANKKPRGSVSVQNLSQASLRKWAQWNPNKTSQYDSNVDKKRDEKEFLMEQRMFNENNFPYLSYVHVEQSQINQEVEQKVLKVSEKQR